MLGRNAQGRSVHKKAFAQAQLDGVMGELVTVLHSEPLDFQRATELGKTLAGIDIVLDTLDTIEKQLAVALRGVSPRDAARPHLRQCSFRRWGFSHFAPYSHRTRRCKTAGTRAIGRPFAAS